MPTHLRTLAIVAAGAAVLAGAAACGSDSSSTPTEVAATTAPAATTAAAPTTTPDKAGVTVAVTMGSPQPFSTTLATTSVKAGSVTFTVANKGAMPHQLDVLKTKQMADKLPMKDATTAAETGRVGGILDIAPGTTKSVTLTLTPGHYSVICNLPGHYQAGMYADLTVTP